MEHLETLKDTKRHQEAFKGTQRHLLRDDHSHFEPLQAGLTRTSTDQLKELGRPDIPFGREAVNLEQFFRIPWAADQAHIDLYKATVEGIAALPAFDGKASILFQMVSKRVSLLISLLNLSVS